jgi:hypothetical protein
MAKPATELTLEERAYRDSLREAVENYKTFTNRLKHLRSLKALLRMILRGALEATGDVVADHLVPGVRMWFTPNYILACSCHGLEAGECPNTMDPEGLTLRWIRNGFRFQVDYQNFRHSRAVEAVNGSELLLALIDTVEDLRIVNDTIECLDGLAEQRLLLLGRALDSTGQQSSQTLVKGAKLKLDPVYAMRCVCHGSDAWNCETARKGETIKFTNVQIGERFGVESHLGETVVADQRQAA